MSRRNTKENFNAYAGKIVNLAEFNLKQPYEVDGFIKAALKIPGFLYAVSTADVYKKAELPVTAFYVAEKDAASSNPPGISAQTFYFEASSVMSAIQHLCGKKSVSGSFKKSVEKCADHRDKLASGQLTGSHGEESVNILFGTKVKPLLTPQQR